MGLFHTDYNPHRRSVGYGGWLLVGLLWGLCAWLVYSEEKMTTVILILGFIGVVLFAGAIVWLYLEGWE